jgi:hypothetical protein
MIRLGPLGLLLLYALSAPLLRHLGAADRAAVHPKSGSLTLPSDSSLAEIPGHGGAYDQSDASPCG